MSTSKETSYIGNIMNMLFPLKEKLNIILTIDNTRTGKIVQNILLSFGAKAGSIIVGLLLMSSTINYVNPDQYGVWLTVSSITSWLNFFDIGMGNGLRNKLTTVLSMENYDEAKNYVSATYIGVFLISIVIFIIIWIVIPFVDWCNLLNIRSIELHELRVILNVVLLSFCVQFVLQIINVVITANQQSSYTAIISFFGQLCSLFGIYLLKKYSYGSLLALISVLTFFPIFILILTSIYLYSTKFKFIRPAFKSIKLEYIKEVLKLGSSFFYIQIGTIVLFQTSNVIISKIDGSRAVTEFNVVYKLFSIVIMVFSIIVTPYWSAFTDAYTQNDFSWLKKSLKMIRMIWVITTLIILPIIVIMSNFIYSLWIGNSIYIPMSLTMSTAFYTSCYMGMTLSCYFLNGIGKLKLQQRLYTLACFINVPLGMEIGKYVGVSGVVLANTIVMLFMLIVLWIQINKIINKKASGIWIK